MKRKLSEAQLAQRRANGIKVMAARTPAERSAMGKKGFAATVAKHGRDKAFEAMRRRQLEHPSALEIEVEGILRELGVDYVKQARLTPARLYSVDFLVGHYAIEVDGPPHDLHPETESVVKAEKKALAEAGGLMLVNLHHSTRPQWRQTLRDLLSGA